MLDKKKRIKLSGTLACPPTVGCSAFIQMQGSEPIRTTAVEYFIHLPFGVTYIETRNTRYLLFQPAKAAVKGVGT